MGLEVSTHCSGRIVSGRLEKHLSRIAQAAKLTGTCLCSPRVISGSGSVFPFVHENRHDGEEIESRMQASMLFPSFNVVIQN